MPLLDQNASQALDEIRKITEPQEDGALVRIAARQTEEHLSLLSARVEFVKPSEKPSALRRYAYPEIVLAEQWLEREDAIEWLRQLLESKKAHLPEVGLIECPYSNASVERHPSGRTHYFASHTWPTLTLEAHVTPSDHQQFLARSGPLVGQRLPLYPNVAAAILSFVHDYQTLHDTNSRIPVLVVLASDRRARIARMQLRGLDFVVTVEQDLSVPCVVKLFGPTIPPSSSEGGIQIDENGCASARLSGPADFMYVGLVNPGGTLLDERKEFLGWPWSQSNVEILPETREEQILQMIDRWETDQIEFKPALKKEDIDDFLETVVAFANTRGGVIILGVNKNRFPTGFSDPGFEERLSSLLYNRCHPIPNCKVEEVLVSDKKLTLVHVEELIHPTLRVCALDHTKIFLRHHENDFQATVEELARIFDTSLQS